MKETSDEEVDRLLARHLGACLGGQSGRAEAAFGREWSDGRRRLRRRIGAWAGAAAAIAAGVAAAWLIPGGPVRSDKPIDAPGPIAVAAPQAAVIERATWSPVTDDGTALLDQRPVRRLRQQMVEEVEWYDPRSNATVRTTIPRERIVLIGMRTD